MTNETRIVLTAQDKTRAALDSVKRGMAGVQSAGNSLHGVLGKLSSFPGLGALAGGLSGAAIAGFVKGAVDAVDALNDVADATGASVENISALEDVARRTGGTLDTVQGVLVKFNAILNDADPDSGAAAALKALGLNAEELKRLDPAEALLKTAQALSGFANDANKARDIQKLFGKSIAEVAPFLKDLAEQGRLNATVTSEQAAQAEAFNKRLFEMQTNVSAAARAYSLEMLPVLERATFQFTEQAEAAGLLKGALAGIGEIASPLRTFFETIVVLGANVAYVFNGIGTEIGGIAAQIGALMRLDFRGFAEIGRMMKEDAAQARKDIDAFSARMLDRTKAPTTGEGGPDFVGPSADLKARPSLPSSRTPPKPAKPAKAAPAYDAELEMSRRAAEAYAGALGKITDAQRSAEDSLLDLTPAEQALRDLMADPVWQAMPETWRQVATAQAESAVAAEKSAKATKEYEDRLKALLDASSGAQLEKQRKDMLLLADAFQKGRISAEEFSDAAGTALGTLPDAAKDAADEIDQFMIQAARNIQDAFAEFLFDPFKDGLGGMLKGFGQMIQRMIAQAVAADLGRRLFGADFAAGKPGADIGGWIGSLLSGGSSFFGGGGSAAASIAGPATGSFVGATAGVSEVFPVIGSFDVGTPYVPRDGLAMIHRGERIIPAAENAAGSYGGNVTINVHVPAGTAPQMRASAAQGAREALGALNRARRYG